MPPAWSCVPWAAAAPAPIAIASSAPASRYGRCRFMSVLLSHHGDLAPHDVGALGFDQREVAAARDRPAVAVRPVPHPGVESRDAALGALRERALQHEVAGLREDAQR